MKRDLTVQAVDGYPLEGTLWEQPKSGSPGIVVIQSATGVKRGYYAPFAEWLFSQGFSVFTFDYRGIGGSRPKEGLRGFRATMKDWAQLDAQGVLRWAKDRFPGKRLLAVGHSFGGQVFGLLRDTGGLAKVVLIGAQFGYWRNYPIRTQPRLFFTWYAMIPALTAIAGYFPAKRLGIGEDLPLGVANEWRGWCCTESYLAAELERGAQDGFQGLRCPIRVYEATDDVFAPHRPVREMTRFLPEGRWEIRTLDPRAFGLGEIGHFGYFRPKLEQTFWRELSAWLKEAG